jgi:hypothetical protein
LAITVHEYASVADQSGSAEPLNAPDLVTTHATQVTLAPATRLADVTCSVDSWVTLDGAAPSVTTGRFVRAGRTLRVRKTYLAAMTVKAAAAAAGEGASEAHLGEVGGNAVTITQIPGVSTTAYSAGDCVGGLMTFAGLARTAGGSGFVQQVTVNCRTAQTGALDLVLFKANPTGSTFTDNAALAVSSGDFDKVMGVVHITDWTSVGAGSTAQADNLAKPFSLSSGTSGWGVLVARSTPTLGSISDLSVDLRVVRN